MLSLVEITAFRLESKSCKGFVLQINFPPIRALEFIRDHATFKLPYDFSYHMKTPFGCQYPMINYLEIIHMADSGMVSLNFPYVKCFT